MEQLKGLLVPGFSKSNLQSQAIFFCHPKKSQINEGLMIFKAEMAVVEVIQSKWKPAGECETSSGYVLGPRLFC